MGTKIFYWTHFDRNLAILVPKKRGTGYLRYPIYHNVNLLANHLTKNYPDYDADGIDGYLNIKVGFLTAGINQICLPIVRSVVDFCSIPDSKIEYINYKELLNKALYGAKKTNRRKNHAVPKSLDNLRQ